MAEKPYEYTERPTLSPPPLQGCDPLKRESIVRILQHLQIAIIQGLDDETERLEKLVLDWVMCHIPNTVLLVAGTASIRNMNDRLNVNPTRFATLFAYGLEYHVRKAKGETQDG